MSTNEQSKMNIAAEKTANAGRMTLGAIIAAPFLAIWATLSTANGVLGFAMRLVGVSIMIVLLVVMIPFIIIFAPIKKMQMKKAMKEAEAHIVDAEEV